MTLITITALFVASISNASAAEMPACKVRPLILNEFSLSRPQGCEGDNMLIMMRNDTDSCMSPSWVGVTAPTLVTTWGEVNGTATKVGNGMEMPNGHPPPGCVPPGQYFWSFMPWANAQIEGRGFNVPTPERELVFYNGAPIEVYSQFEYTPTGELELVEPTVTYTCKPFGIGRPKVGPRAEFNLATCQDLRH